MAKAETQFVLIGSGVAAVTLAERLLSADPETHITILEAGKEYPAMDRRAWWDYVMTGKAVYNEGVDTPNEYEVDSNVHWDCHDNRVIAYGGSTLHWGGWSLRFKPEDFHLRENTGLGADWPFPYSTLHDYYYEAEHLLGVCGDDRESWNHMRHELKDSDDNTIRRGQPYPLPPFEWTAADGEMIQGFRKAGIEPGRMPISRYRKCMATGTCKYCPLGARYTAQNALNDLKTRKTAEGRIRYPNLHVWTNSPVRCITMKSKRIASGVKYFDAKSGRSQEIKAETVVVCAGAYESPKVLLQSKDDFWPKGIGNHHDQVGRYLISHSILRVRGENRANKESWVQEYDFPTLMSRTYDTPEYQQFGKLFLFKNRKYPHLDFARAMSGNSVGGVEITGRADLEKQLRGPRTMELQGFLEEKGRFENRVTAGEERTRWKLPKTHVVFHRTPAEIANADSRMEILKRVLREMDYKVTEAEVDRPGGHHGTGTCRMSRDPKQGVTDADLRVHGTENVYVCSNAVFPTGSAVNPTLTLTALSLRLGDHFTPRAGQTRETVGTRKAAT